MVSVALLALTACSSAEPVRDEVDAGTADLMYDAEVNTLADLVKTSESVVLAQPLPEEEAVLLDVDGVQVLGRSFRVVQSYTGHISAGDEIVVARPRYGVSPDMEAQLNERGMTATLPPDEETENPPFDRPLYVLGLKYTGSDYPVPAWTTANGPHSRIAFDAAEPAAATAVVEVPDTPLQERLAGKRARQILRRLQRR